MIPNTRFALNRIASPARSLGEFFQAAASLGLSAVELRNDIRDGAVIDGLPPAEVRKLAQDAGIHIASINALQQFNVPMLRTKKLSELESLINLCLAIDCPALVLCPNNRPDDQRAPEQKYHDTVESLNTYAPLLTKAGILGLVEPLGFRISSLSSAEVAMKAIQESGANCYRLLIDTFHQYLGSDSANFLLDKNSIANIGLVHISGVEAPLPKEQLSDAHRILPSTRDVMKSAELVAQLEKAGYRGLYSFEPFSNNIQTLPLEMLKNAIRSSIDYIAHV